MIPNISVSATGYVDNLEIFDANGEKLFLLNFRTFEKGKYLKGENLTEEIQLRYILTEKQYNYFKDKLIKDAPLSLIGAKIGQLKVSSKTDTDTLIQFFTGGSLFLPQREEIRVSAE